MNVRNIGLILAVLLLQGCNGNGNGSDGGGEPCADSFCSSRETCVNNSVCVAVPTKPANACEEGAEEGIYHATGPADLTCHNKELCTADTDCPQDAAGTQLVCRSGFCGVPAPQGPATVTFRGCVDAFGISDTTDEMRVALYRYTQDPQGTSTWDVATFNDEAHCNEWGAFEFTDVPTNTPLILKSYDAQGDFVVTYKYNLILWADLAQDEGGGSFVFDTRDTVADPRTGADISLDPWRGYAISQTTYDIILLAAGISELPETHGAIAGTIRDCGYHEMENITCGFVEEPTVLTYMSNSESPRPQQALDATNVNGMYAAMDIPEGSHRVSCLAQGASNTDIIPLGEYDVKVFPHAVTILSMDWYPGVE